MAPSVERSLTASTPSKSSSESRSSTSSRVERKVQGSPAGDVESRSAGEDVAAAEDSTESTGRKGNEGDDLPRLSVSDQSEHVSIVDSEGTPLIVLPTNCSFYLGWSKVTHNLIQEYM